MASRRLPNPQVSVSEVLHRTFTAAIGERNEAMGVQQASPCTEIPSLAAMFSVVKKVRWLVQ